MTGLDVLRRVRGFVVDLDGTTYLGDVVIEGAARFLNVLARSGRRHVFVTNNSSTSGATYATKLRGMGLDVSDSQVLTSGEATAMYLRRRRLRKLFVLGTPALEDELKRGGFTFNDSRPDCVVLGFDRTLTYRKLETATHLIRKGVPFVATHPDLVCPTEDGYIPDCGSMIALLTASTGVVPTVVGKPEPLLVEMALSKLAFPVSQVAVVGDRLYTDIVMGQQAGAVTVLVLSGETTPEMVAASARPPDLVMNNVGALADVLEALDAAPVHATQEPT